MKKLLVILFLSLSICGFAQVQNAFKYQAVARDAAGDLIVNLPVAFQISILQGGPAGTIVYTETHGPATNDFGLVNLEIGIGTVVTGDFTTIDWSLGDYFLQIEMDETGGTNFQLMGTSQLLSVPFALYAESSGNSDDGDWTISGNDMYSNVTGNVGIGITNPTSKLELGNAGSYLYENTSQRLSIYSDGANAYSRVKFHRSHSPIMGDDTSSNAVTQDGDKLGLVVFGGNRINGAGASSGSAGWMEMIQKGDATVSGIPGQIQFITADGLGERETRMVISPTGNVGITTDNPQANLDIGGRLFFSASLGGSPEGQIDFNNNSGSSERMIIRKNVGESTFGEINVVSDHDLRFRTSDIDRITIKNNGFVGIGTTTPQNDLELRTSDPDDAASVMFSNSDQSHYFQFFPGRQGNQNPWIAWGGGDPLRFISGSIEHFRIASDGNIGIGISTPNEKLDINGNLDMNGNQIKNMVIENRTSDPSSPAVGQIWIRTDL